jgi:hypothetical protein
LYNYSVAKKTHICEKDVVVMLKSIKLAVLGLVAIPLTFSVIPPVKAVDSTTENEPVVTLEDREILIASPYRDRNYDRYNDGGYRRHRNYQWDNRYNNDDEYRGYRRHRNYQRYDGYEKHPGYGQYREYRRYVRHRRCFYRVEYDGYGDRYRIRVCQ